MLTARREIGVRQPQVRVPNSALLDILGGVGIPGQQCLIDQLIKPGPNRRKNDLIKEGWHQQVSVMLQGPSLLRDEQSVPSAYDRHSSLQVHCAAID